jgi:hypothetical protein
MPNCLVLNYWFFKKMIFMKKIFMIRLLLIFFLFKQNNLFGSDVTPKDQAKRLDIYCQSLKNCGDSTTVAVPWGIAGFNKNIKLCSMKKKSIYNQTKQQFVPVNACLADKCLTNAHFYYTEYQKVKNEKHFNHILIQAQKEKLMQLEKLMSEEEYKKCLRTAPRS